VHQSFTEMELIERIGERTDFRRDLLQNRQIIRTGVEAMMKFVTAARSRAGVKYGFIIRADDIAHAVEVNRIVRGTAWPNVGSEVTAMSRYPTCAVLASSKYEPKRNDKVRMTDEEQDKIYDMFNRGDLDVIVLADMWKEGYDNSRIIGEFSNLLRKKLRLRSMMSVNPNCFT
jgi:hypothetical protein